MHNTVRPKSLNHETLAPYRNLRQGPRPGGRFIVEGEHLVRRLLASGFAVESVLVSEKRAGRIRPLVPEAVPLHVLPEAAIERLVGFSFHRGVLACGIRGKGATLDDVLQRAGERALLVVCPRIGDAENLGAIVRSAAAFGADALLLGPQGADPFGRRAIRVSMGAAFSLPIVQSADMAAEIRRLLQWGASLYAAVLDNDATPLPSVAPAAKSALLFGEEAEGLAPEWLAFGPQKVRIPMSDGVDSLNVAAAAAVFLYHFSQCRGEGPAQANR